MRAQIHIVPVEKKKKTPEKTGRRVPVKCKSEEVFCQLTE